MSTTRLDAADLADLMGLHRPTEEQAEVIQAPLAPMLVVAGAGSGKTDTMASRVVWLIANGLLEPREVLGLTFTRKAAHELLERISGRLGLLATACAERGIPLPRGLERGADDLIGQRPHVATYNGFALDLVREHALAVGLDPEATMMSASASFQLAYEVVEGSDDSLDVDASPATLTSALVSLSSSLADHLLTPRDLEEELRGIRDHLAGIPLQREGRRRAVPKEVAAALGALDARLAVIPLLERFAQLRAERGALDFSDQVSLAARIAAEVPAARELARDQHRVVLLDEFQDTSVAQLRMLVELLGPGHPACAVGDPQQAIYGWRGASAASLDGFAEAFATPERPVLQRTLSTSWRNDEAVLAAANRIASPLREASAGIAIPELRPRPGAGEGAVEIHEAADVRSEARAIAAWIHRHRRERPEASAAVLVRARRQIPMLERVLVEEGLPVQVMGLGGLLHRPEVADVRALLEAVHDAGRGDSLMRLLTGPRFRLGARDLAVLGRWREDLARRLATGRSGPDDADQVSLLDAVDDLPRPDWADADGRTLSPAARERLLQLQQALRDLRRRLGLPLPDLITAAVRALGTDQAVLAGDGRLEGLEALRSHASAFEASASRPGLGPYLALLDISEDKEAGLAVTAAEEDPDPAAVTLVTMHSAKGLEWDLVAVAGLTEGSVPAYDLRRARTGEDGRVRTVSSGWLGPLADAVVPSSLRGDAATLPQLQWSRAETQVEAIDVLDEFFLAQGEETLLEDRRLMYVAVTRARARLLLTSAAWRESAARPRPRSRYLLEAAPVVPEAHRRSEEVPEENPLEKDIRTAQYPPPPGNAEDARDRAAAEVARAATSAASPAADPWEEAVHRVLRDLADRRSRLAVHAPARMSASQLVARADRGDDAALDLIRPLPRRPSAAARHGTAFHAWLEGRYGPQALLDLEDLAEIREDDPAGTLAALQEAFSSSPWAERSPLAVEEPVALNLEGIVVRGVIDAVFPDPAPDSAEDAVIIVDWKTGARPRGARRAARALQLSVYRLAWHERTGLPLARIRTAFHYVADGITDEIREHPTREELARLLSGGPQRTA